MPTFDPTVGQAANSGVASQTTLNESGLNAELSRAFVQLHALNVSITAERARGNVAGVQAMLPLYQSWLQRYKDVAAQLGQKDFTKFDSFVLDTGTYIAKASDAASQLAQDVGKGLLKTLWPFFAIAGAFLFIKAKL